MSNPSHPHPPGGDRHEKPDASGDLSLGFEESLRQFWERYRNIIIAACALVLLVMAARGGWQVLQERRAEARADAYAAAESDEELLAFATEHAGSELAGVARLKVADRAFEAGRYEQAAQEYTAAAETLGETPMAGRARLGLAVSQLKAGQAEPGRRALQQVANDVGAPKAFRAETAYHLASLAAESGNADEVRRLVEQVRAIDPASVWAQRADLLAETVASSDPRPEAPEEETAATEPAADEEPTVSFPGVSSP